MNEIINKINEKEFSTSLDNENFSFSKYIDFCNSAKHYFTGRFEFSGDDKFDRKTQMLFLNTLFDYGRVGILKKGELRIPLIINTVTLDYNGNIKKGLGYPASIVAVRGIKECLKTFNTKQSNCAYMLWDFYGNSGLSEAYSNAYIYGEVWGVLRNNVKLTSKKYKINANNIQAQEIADTIYSVASKVLPNVDTTQRRTISDLAVNRLTSSNVLGTDNLESILPDGTFNPYIEDLIRTIEQAKSDYTEMYGKRRNTNTKKERNINAEFEADEFNYQLIENRIIPFLDKFIVEYNKLFNTNIVLIDNIKKINEASQEVIGEYNE